MLLRSYALLSRDALNTRIPRWPMKPKHHHLWHGYFHALLSKINPRATWLQGGPKCTRGRELRSHIRQA
eukprot:5578863-Alexandrium_andersonii.AAC.1